MGFLLLTASSLFLDKVRPLNSSPWLCDYLAGYLGSGYCDAIKAWLGTTSLGIIISVVQILFAIFALIKIVS